MTTIADNFNRADNFSSLGVTSTGGFTWTYGAGGNHWDVISNQAVVNSPGTCPLTFIDTSATDGTVQVTLSTIGGTGQGVLARYQDDNNFWCINAKTGASSSQVRKVVGGGASALTTFTAAQGDVLKAVMSGSSISFYQNGSLLLTDSSGFGSTATKHGMWSQETGQTGGLDDWSFVPAAPPAWRRPTIVIRPRALVRASVI